MMISSGVGGFGSGAAFPAFFPPALFAGSSLLARLMPVGVERG